jgi:glycosyltransferase involved in cell wall biosynthesis
MRISIITPSLNSARFIEQAITSVTAQGCDDVEHIVVDAASTDGTVEILKKFQHLQWVSEPDRGQSDAMNKAFEMCSGDIIGNLNADDYYLPNAFRTVLTRVEEGRKFVMGRVKIIQENGDEWINDPQTDIRDMLQWWNKDAYCRNPVGFFYHRSIHEAVGGFDVDNHNTMDLDFLLRARQLTEFTRIPDILGVFQFIGDTKTSRSQSFRDVQRKFSICNQFVEELDREFQELYRAETKKFIQNRMASNWRQLATTLLRRPGDLSRQDVIDLAALFPAAAAGIFRQVTRRLRR